MADAGIPTAHAIRSACEAARILQIPTTPLADARESFRRLPSNGRFGGNDFEVGEAILRSVELVDREGETIVVSESVTALQRVGVATAEATLLELIFERRPPIWLRTAAGGESLNEEIVPDGQLDS